MNEEPFNAEFKEVRMLLPRHVLKTFIHKLLTSDYKLTWRHDQNGIELAIHHQTECVNLPMTVRSEKETLIQLKELEVTNEDLAVLLEDLLVLCKGAGVVKTVSEGIISVSYYEQGKLVSIFRTDTEDTVDKLPDLKVKQSEEDDREMMIQLYIINGEIDYYLMELNEVLQRKDRIEVLKLKQKLASLSRRKAALVTHN